MRIAIVGASSVGVATARMLIAHKHDVVIVETDRQRIEDLSEDLDCAFLHGDGSRPRVLREVGPQETKFLMCLSDNDQDNILSSLVGRSLGFETVITKIADPEFEPICAELGLEHTISADQITARTLADSVEGRDAVDLSTVLRGDIRFFVCVAGEDDAGRLHDLKLPSDTKVLYAYRDGNLIIPDERFEVRKGDNLVLITSSEHIGALDERWRPSPA